MTVASAAATASAANPNTVTLEGSAAQGLSLDVHRVRAGQPAPLRADCSVGRLTSSGRHAKRAAAHCSFDKPGDSARARSGRGASVVVDIPVASAMREMRWTKSNELPSELRVACSRHPPGVARPTEYKARNGLSSFLGEGQIWPVSQPCPEITPISGHVHRFEGARGTGLASGVPTTASYGADARESTARRAHAPARPRPGRRGLASSR